MNLNLMLSLEYWIAIRPLAMTSKTAIMLSAFFILMIATGIACRAIYRKLKKNDRFMSYVWRRGASALNWMGSLGLLIVFFRYEGVPMLGMRLWYAAWLIGAIAWGAQIAWYRYKQLPKILAANHEVAMK
ncbi:MAG: hypothetical protein WCJ29_04955 [bacterium]